MSFRLPGQRTTLTYWIDGRSAAGPFVVRVAVEAVIPSDDPGEPCLEPAAIRHLDELQKLADAGRIDDLAKHGEVYVRKSA